MNLWIWFLCCLDIPTNEHADAISSSMYTLAAVSTSQSRRFDAGKNHILTSQAET
jgi:hypothetical protein